MKKILEHLRKKWIRYCFETLAIILGILGAFSLDNWNEERKSLSVQKKSIEKLGLDMISDIERYNYLDSIYDSWSQEVDIILNDVLSGSKDKLTNRGEYSIGRGSFYYVTQKKTMYDEMVNTGVFYMVNNPELESTITEYYEFAEFEITKLNRDNQNLADYFLHPMFEDQKNLAFRLARNRNLEYLDWSWLKDPNSEEYKELENRAIWFDYAIMANQLVLSQLKEKAQNVILQIENYIDE